MSDKKKKKEKINYPEYRVHNNVVCIQVDKDNVKFTIEEERENKDGVLKVYQDLVGFYRLSPKGLLYGLRKSREYVLDKEKPETIDLLIKRFEELVAVEEESFKTLINSKWVK